MLGGVHHPDTHASAIAGRPGRATLGGPQLEWKGGVPLAAEDMAGHELDQMGPVDYVVIEFPDGQPKGEAAPLLVDLVDRGIIRILDLMVIVKNDDGTVSGSKSRTWTATGSTTSGSSRGHRRACSGTKTNNRPATCWSPVPRRS